MMEPMTLPNCNLTPACRCSTISHGIARFKATDHQLATPAKAALDRRHPHSTPPKTHPPDQQPSPKPWQAKTTIPTTLLNPHSPILHRP
jgi:hypothetical protein